MNSGDNMEITSKVNEKALKDNLDYLEEQSEK